MYDAVVWSCYKISLESQILQLVIIFIARCALHRELMIQMLEGMMLCDLLDKQSTHGRYFLAAEFTHRLSLSNYPAAQGHLVFF